MTRDATALFISTYPPQQCGIATFTEHMIGALGACGSAQAARVAALVPKDEWPRFGRRVVRRIENNGPESYAEAARFINESPFDVVSLQHEYGLFSGECGQNVLVLLEACRKPVVTTLHTVLPQPGEKQREVMRGLARRSASLVTMARVGVELLVTAYGVPRDKVRFIAHGVPQVPEGDPESLRRELGLQDRKVVMTFGLLSRGKGIEYMIDALPAIRERHGDVVYMVFGRTHPNVKRQEGQSYRDELQKRARRLGVRGCVHFVNRFVKDDELLRHLQACHVYVTPYLGRDQITSGTLSYAMAAGCAVVSTPYLYAEELLAEGRGRLAAFRDAASLAREITAILDDAALAAELRTRAREFGRSMSWRNVGRQYRELFGQAACEAAPAARGQGLPAAAENLRVPFEGDTLGDRPTVQEV